MRAKALLAAALVASAALMALGMSVVATSSGGSIESYFARLFASLNATAVVEPVRLLGYKETLALEKSIVIPEKVFRKLLVECRVDVNPGPGVAVEPEKPGRLRVEAEVGGFNVTLMEAVCDRVLSIDVGSLRREVTQMALEAGLPKPSRFRVRLVYEQSVTVETPLGERRTTLTPSIELVYTGNSVVKVNKHDVTRMVEVRVEEPPSPWRRWGVALAALGGLMGVAAVTVYVYVRPRDPLAGLPLARFEGLPRVEVNDPQVVWRLARRLGVKPFRSGNMMCTIYLGTLYCAPVASHGGGGSGERGSSGAASKG